MNHSCYRDALLSHSPFRAFCTYKPQESENFDFVVFLLNVRFN